MAARQIDISTWYSNEFTKKQEVTQNLGRIFKAWGTVLEQYITFGGDDVFKYNERAQLTLLSAAVYRASRNYAMVQEYTENFRTPDQQDKDAPADVARGRPDAWLYFGTGADRAFLIEAKKYWKPCTNHKTNLGTHLKKWLSGELKKLRSFDVSYHEPKPLLMPLVFVTCHGGFAGTPGEAAKQAQDALIENFNAITRNVEHLKTQPFDFVVCAKASTKLMTRALKDNEEVFMGLWDNEKKEGYWAHPGMIIAGQIWQK